MHGAVLSSLAPPQSCSEAALSEGDRALSVDGFVSDLVLWFSERGCITGVAQLTALTVVVTSLVEVCFLHSAVAQESWVFTCTSLVVLEISLSKEGLALLC